MPKKSIISIATITAFLGLALFAPSAHANTVVDMITGIAFNPVSMILAFLSTIVLQLASVWIALTGALLNVSIAMTMHIKDFVDSTQGVYLVWQTIRDITGIFIIFMLLYASFKIILGFDTVGSVGTLIKNIVIVGVLINFSFFITSLLIDASNVVSLALYNGIVNQTSTAAPVATKCPTDSAGGTNSYSTCVITSQMYTGTQGGLSAIFMNALNPQMIYKDYGSVITTATSTSSTGVGSPIKIIIQSVIGVLIMFMSGLSFLLASLAFMVRLIVLVILLAFSPIWFASWVIPGLGEEAKKFTKHLKSQLIFMPVYLLLLYAALRILSSSTVFSNPSGNPLQGGTGGALTFIPVNYIILAINDFFIIFLLNMPLVVGLTMGGIATDWIDTKKFGAHGIFKSVGAATGRNTLGRMAHIASNSETLRGWTAKSPLIGGLLTKGSDKVAGFGFGQKKGSFKDVQEAKQKEYEAMYKKLSTPDASRYDDTVKDSDGKTALMRAKEKAKLDAEKYYDNTQETIMGRLMKNVANRGAVSGQFSGDGPFPKQQSKASALLYQAAATNEAVSRAVGVNMSGRKAAVTMQKEKDATKKKADAKAAEEALDGLEAVNDKINEQYDDLKTALESNEKDLGKAIADREEALKTITKTHEQALADFIATKQQAAQKLRTEIETTETRNNEVLPANRTSTSTQRASLAQIEKEITERKDKSKVELANKRQKLESEIDSFKTKRVEAGQEKMKAATEIKAANDEFKKQKEAFQKAIKAGKEVSEAERDAKLVGEFKKAVEGDKDKGGGGAPKADKPAAPTT